MIMQNKLVLLVLGLAIVLLTTGMTGGCGMNSSTKTYYYYPDWTPDGRIICSKNIQTVSGGSGPTPGTSIDSEYYLAIIDENGSNEANIKRIENAARVATSPLGNYYAYSCWDPNSNYIIRVIDNAGNNLALINLTSEVSGLDWSPDETKLVYGITNDSTEEIHIVNKDGTNDSLLTVGGNPVWRIGDHIAFEYSTPEGITLSLIKSDGSSLTNLRIGYDAQFINTNKLIYRFVPQVRQINIDGTGDEQLFTDYSYRKRPRLSADKTKLVAMDASKGYGILVINISGTGEVQVK